MIFWGVLAVVSAFVATRKAVNGRGWPALAWYALSGLAWITGIGIFATL